MITLLLLLVAALALATATLVLLPHDGRGPALPPSSHADDHRYHAPGGRWARA